MPRCTSLCVARAACVEADIATYESSWSKWTGFDDRGAYEEACLDEFERSVAAGEARGAVEDFCEAEEAENGCL